MKPKVVLVVEDDPVLATIYERALQKGGYEVLTAADGESALKLVESDAPIDLILSDVVMPGMGGRELVWRVRDIRPDIRIILASGYAAEDSALQTLEDIGVGFISKPIELATLVQVVTDKLKD